MRLRRPAARESVGQHHRIQCAGRAAGDTFHLEPSVGQNLVEHSKAKAPWAPPPCKARLIVFFRSATRWDGLPRVGRFGFRRVERSLFEIKVNATCRGDWKKSAGWRHEFGNVGVNIALQ
jgi:hypothetical protein